MSRDDFFNLTLGDNLGTQLRKFSEITDKKEAAAALDAQILAYKDQIRSTVWAKDVIALREEVMNGYTALLAFSKEKDTLTALYNEATAYLEKQSAEKISRAKAELDKLEKAKRTVTWCGKVEDLWNEVSEWTKAEQTSSGCRERLSVLMKEFDDVKAADQLDDTVAKLEKAKNKDEDWCDKVDALAPSFESRYAKYATSEPAYRKLQKQAVDVRRYPIVDEYKALIASAANKDINSTLARQYRKLDKNISALSFKLADYMSDFALSWKALGDKVSAFEKAEQDEADRAAKLRQTFKQYLYREEDDGSIFIGRYKGNEEVVTLPEGVREIGASAFAGNESLTELNLPDSLEIIGEGAFSDCTSLAFITFGAGLLRVEAEAFFACTSLATVSLPRSVNFVGDKAFAKCKKLGRFSPLSSRCKTGKDYLEGTLYIKRQEEEAAREAEQALIDAAQKVDDRITELSEMDRNKTWVRLLKQVREEVNALKPAVSVKLRKVGVLEKMEFEAERLVETNRLDEMIGNIADDSRTPSWCKKIKALYDAVTQGEYPCRNLALLKNLYQESVKLEKDLAQAEQDEIAKQQKLADQAAAAEAQAVDDKILAAKSMKRDDAWATRLQDIRSEVKKLSSAAKKKLCYLADLENMEAEAKQREKDLASARAKAKAKARAREDRIEAIKEFLGNYWLLLIAVLIAGVGAILHRHWCSPLLTGFGAGMFLLVLTLKIDEESDYGAISIYRLVLFLLGLGGMITLCCLSRYWALFSTVLALGFAISYIVAAWKDNYDVEFEIAGVFFAILFSLSVIAFFLVYSLFWGFKDYKINNGVLKDYNVRGEVVVTVPDGVTAIGANAFYDVDRIEKVILPDSVNEIGYDAFAMCDNLKEIVYGDNVVKIDARAFRGNTFTYVYVPAEVTDISFLDNVKAEEIIISEDNDYFALDGSALIDKQNNSLLKAGADGIIPEYVTGIASNAFTNLPENAVLELDLPNVTTIDANVFSGVKARSITVGGGIKTLKFQAFKDCTVTELIILENVETIEVGALEDCRVTNLTIPFIGTRRNSPGDKFGAIFGTGTNWNYSYKDAHKNRIPTDLKKVTVLSGDIYEGAFSEVKGIETVIVLGASRIEYNAFYYCNKLTTLYLASTVEYLGEAMLLAGKSVTLNIYYQGTEAEWEAIEKYVHDKNLVHFSWDYGKATKPDTIQVSYNHEVPN